MRKSIVLNSLGFHFNADFQVLLYGRGGFPELSEPTVFILGVNINPSISYSYVSDCARISLHA